MGAKNKKNAAVTLGPLHSFYIRDVHIGQGAYAKVCNFVVIQQRTLALLILV